MQKTKLYLSLQASKSILNLGAGGNSPRNFKGSPRAMASVSSNLSFSSSTGYLSSKAAKTPRLMFTHGTTKSKIGSGQTKCRLLDTSGQNPQ